LGARLGLLAQLLLQVVVQIFVGIVVRGVGRQVEQLDLMGMGGDPRRDLGGMVHLQVVDDQEHLLPGILAQPG
jgi:hypothetical protein